MYASAVKKRGLLYIPVSTFDCLSLADEKEFSLTGTVKRSIFGEKVLARQHLYIRREGIIYVSGNHWLYKLQTYGVQIWLPEKPDPLRIWRNLSDGEPLEFEKISRVELTFL